LNKERTNGQKPAIALVGPTASGKTGLALLVAESLGTEIIGVDSRQIYRRLDIGTAKPTAAQVARVPHHLIDLVDPEERYSVGQYRRDVLDLLPRFEEAGRIPFFVGGTGFYLKAVLEGLCPGPEANVDLRHWLQKAAAYPAGGLHSLLQRIDPESADRIHRNDSYRLTRALEVYYVTGETLSDRQKRHRFSDRPFRTVIVGLTREKGELKERMGRRVEEMLDSGFAGEVAGLLEEGYDPSLHSLRAVGYPQMIEHLRGEKSLDEAAEEIRKATWQYARRQLTWFRGVPDVKWLSTEAGRSDESLAEEVLALVDKLGKVAKN
jgi:tRNA dimethylallyltransferase